MSILSVDLAYKAYTDIGAVEMTRTPAGVRCDLLRIPLLGDPTPDRLAEYLASTCDQRGISIMLLDGPQAWKAEDNGLEHSRRCERELGTPAKTGLPGMVKPGNYRGFVEFSIAVFDALDNLGWPRLSDPAPVGAARTAFESFPLSAWRSLGIPSLPAKAKARPEDLRNALQRLHDLIPLHLTGALTHDGLQAIVAGLAGVAIEAGATDTWSSTGIPPFVRGGFWREGFIVNPIRGSLH